MSARYTEISYKDLGDFVGKKILVPVSKDWLDVLRGAVEEKATSKECTKCNQVLPLSKFNNDKRRKFGKRSQCKDCYNSHSSAISSSHTVSKKEESPKIEFTLTTFNEPNE
tara:strand:+ start:389 stop:721 length:333 start_codon:yes stop_codon:yes gene_type:complete